jgi:hypothetical protein
MPRRVGHGNCWPNIFVSMRWKPVIPPCKKRPRRRCIVFWPSNLCTFASGSLNLAQPPLKKPALAVVGDQSERARVALRRFSQGSGAAQQIGPRSVQQMIAVEIATPPAR